MLIIHVTTPGLACVVFPGPKANLRVSQREVYCGAALIAQTGSRAASEELLARLFGLIAAGSRHIVLDGVSAHRTAPPKQTVGQALAGAAVVEALRRAMTDAYGDSLVSASLVTSADSPRSVLCVCLRTGEQSRRFATVPVCDLAADEDLGDVTARFAASFEKLRAAGCADIPEAALVGWGDPVKTEEES